MEGSLSRFMQARLKYVQVRLHNCDDQVLRKSLQDSTVSLLLERLKGYSLSASEQTVLIEMFNSADCLRDAQRGACQDAISTAIGGVMAQILTSPNKFQVFNHVENYLTRDDWSGLTSKTLNVFSKMNIVVMQIIHLRCYKPSELSVVGFVSTAVGGALLGKIQT